MSVFNKFQVRYLRQCFRLCSSITHTSEYLNNIEILKAANYKNFGLVNIDSLSDIKISERDWEDICSQACQSTNDTTLRKRLPQMLITRFTRVNKLSLLESFISFVMKDKVSRDPYILLSLINMKFLDNKYHEELIKLYEECVTDNEYEVLFNSYVKSLLQNNQRAKGLKLLDNRVRDDNMLIHIVKTSPPTENWSHIRRYVDEYLQRNDDLPQRIEDAIVDKISNETDFTALRDAFALLSGKCESLGWDTIEKLQALFRGSDRLRLVTDSVRGSFCVNCGTELKAVNLTLKNCVDIAEILMTDIMQIHSVERIYESSSPEVLENFQNFVKTADMPFDCVIDFPNFFYQLRLERVNRDPQMVATMLTNRLVWLHKTNNNFRHFCFVGKYSISIGMGSHEFMCIVRRLLKSHNIRISYFFCDFLTKDDILALYVALKSGPDCFLVTNDEFRNHRFLVRDPVAKRNFAQWQAVRQILVSGHSSKFHTTKPFIMPTQLKAIIGHHRISGRDIWHIPYSDNKETKISYKSTTQWSCLMLEEDCGAVIEE